MEGLIWGVFLLIGLIIYFYDKNSKKQRTDEYETLLLDTNFEGELISDEEKKHCVTINKSKKQEFELSRALSLRTLGRNNVLKIKLLVQF